MTADWMTGDYPPRRLYSIPLSSGRALDLGARPLIMGILNVTPDSFAESVSTVDPQAALDRALRMEAEGADLIDVGAESTRPGASPIDADEELGRLLPVIRRLAGRVRLPLSIDTYKADVARAALDAGAVIVNDVSGLRFDSGLPSVVAASGAALVLAHSRGRPKTMNDEAVYGDVVADVIRELRDAVARATGCGVPRERIVLDPGIGFAKRASHSYGVLARFPEVAAALDRPLLVGPSRKSFLCEALADRRPSDRDWGTAAAVAASVLNGAHIVRVHAVAEMLQVARVAEEIRKNG